MGQSPREVLAALKPFYNTKIRHELHGESDHIELHSPLKGSG